ncbi:hypothetical protein COLO4_13219 [Corchorus olitorius]|uniref:Uncharacterized protein n=1 Tax=Corchorus olitorius TaxID=93759 RepID=A0A1R3JXY3_9ROSI|nr:hypothetical protein COLO4_13219 [Corchorus olitorius]
MGNKIFHDFTSISLTHPRHARSRKEVFQSRFHGAAKPMARTEDPSYLARRQCKGILDTYPCGSPNSATAETYLCTSED